MGERGWRHASRVGEGGDCVSELGIALTNEPCEFSFAARVAAQLVAHSFRNLRVASSNPARVTSRFFFLQGRFMHMPVNTAVRAVVRSPGKAAPLGLLCLRVSAFT